MMWRIGVVSGNVVADVMGFGVRRTAAVKVLSLRQYHFCLAGHQQMTDFCRHVPQLAYSGLFLQNHRQLPHRFGTDSEAHSAQRASLGSKGGAKVVADYRLCAPCA